MEESLQSPRAVCGRLYVANDLRNLAATREGERTWWCVAKSSVDGDLGIIYHTGVGIQYIFKFLEFEEPQQFCSSFGMATGQIEILTVLSLPVTVQQLRRRDSEFRALKAVRRNFQNRWFDIEDEKVESFYNHMIVQCKPRKVQE